MHEMCMCWTLHAHLHAILQALQFTYSKGLLPGSCSSPARNSHSQLGSHLSLIQPWFSRTCTDHVTLHHKEQTWMTLCPVLQRDAKWLDPASLCHK